MSHRRRRPRPIIVGALAIGALLLGCGSSAADAASGRLSVGSVARLPAGARSTGALATSVRLPLSIALAPRDPAGLQSYATAVSTPGSPDFHRYLSVAQFARTYGATTFEIAVVQAELRAAGLTVGTPMANHLTLPVSGTADQVERAFATQLSQVKLTDGRAAYANTVAPTVPAPIAGDVQGVIGLNDLFTEQRQGTGLAEPHALAGDALAGDALAPQAFTGHAATANAATANAATGAPQPCATATDTGQNDGGYTADTIASAYGFSSLYGAGDLGAGQTVALYELEPYNAADIAAYQGCYGTSASVTDVDVDNAPPFASNDDDAEAALDIEQVIGLAPAARIIVYQAPNNNTGAIDNFATIVSQDQAKVVSTSWGECEAEALSGGTSELQSENHLFEEAAVQGQSIYAASGDSGSAACSQANPDNTSLSVGDPASQPFVTGVGGTTLYSTDGGLTPAESVWNDGVVDHQPSASSGGISSYWPMPSYQSGAATSVGVINSLSSGAPCSDGSYCREVPDVSADADPATGYVVYTDGSWGVIAGTSAAAPLWAAFTALVNASSTCGSRTVGFVNPGLYHIAGYGYAANLTDVTLASPITGLANNDALGVNAGLYPVTTGYDMATGLGTPLAPTLANSMCTIYSVTVTSPGQQSGFVGTPVSLQVHATDSGGAALTYTATGLPSGLSIDAASGRISGKPKQAGNSTVTVTTGDQYHNTAQTSFSWTIAPAGPPTVTHDQLTGVSQGKPKLSVTTVAGHNAPALKSVSVTLPSGLSFAKSAKSLDKGIRVADGKQTEKFAVTVKRGVATISFDAALGSATITIDRPAISVSRSLATRVKDRRVTQLALVLRATDTSKTTTVISVHTKV